jgi:hypothetical protein
MTKPTDRMTRLRDELVATVNAAPYAKARFDPRVIVAAFGAFALAGAITGGAISATALSSTPDTTLSVDVDALARNILGHSAQLIGTPVILSGSGTSSIDLGERPDDATSISMAFTCLDAGDFTFSVNGTRDSSTSCSADDAGSDFGFGSSAGGQYELRGDGPQTLTISSGGSSRYAVWVSWSSEEPVPETSAVQTAELADGQASRDEYLSAFGRFSTCMSEAGEPLLGVDTSGTLVSYRVSNESVDTGTDARCYEPEFRLVDAMWQEAHEDTSESAVLLRDCVEAAGMAPAETLAENHEKLRAAGLLESCR